jgi:serine/threonine protein kinase
MAGQTIGKYALVKKLATGGMAEVWLARQEGIEGFNRHIVVKRILPHLSEDPEFVQMFLNEAKIASRFSHPNIAQIYDLGNSDGQYFIAMEFIHGEDLGRLMRKAWSTGQWIARPLAIRIIAEACKGLFYAHTRNDDSGKALRVVHRDISPQNILISFDGSVKLVDFGIAKAADQASMTKSGAIKGKFAYMAPEQAGGKPLDARTDLFALGLVLYELLTGVRPLKRDSELATLQAALECAIDPPSVVAEVPSELDDVVMRALAKAPDDRYRDASAFQMALEEFLISQRLVATSVQIAELMETLFAERRLEEQKLGAPNPSVQGESREALPAMPDEPSQSGQREGTGTDAARPGEAGRDRGEESNPEWEAPVAEEDEQPPPQQVQPSRRYNQGGNTSLARGQSGSHPEVTRARPLTREVEEALQVEPSVSRKRSSKPVIDPMNGVNGHGANGHGEDGALQTYDSDPPEAPRAPETLPPPGMPKRSSSGPQNRVRRSGEMPQAPARRSRADLEPQQEEDEAQRLLDAVEKPRPVAKKKKKPIEKSSKDLDLDKAIDLEALKQQQAKRRGIALLAMLGVCLVILGAIGWKLFPSHNFDEQVPIILSVTSNPRAKVLIKHGGKTLDMTELGETPIDDSKGAFQGDTVMLVNEDLCITDEVSIQFAEPNSRRIIEKDYSEGLLTVTTKPPLKNIGIFCFNQKRGQTGISTQMYEGNHKLELRDERLTQPVPFDMKIIAKQMNKIQIDISDVLRKGAQP